MQVQIKINEKFVAIVAGSILLTGGIAVGTLRAQRDNFPDVADTHWAYEALSRLKKDGLILGYPDGQFKGPRPVTRYESASMIYSAYQNLKIENEGLKENLKAIESQLNSISSGSAEISNVKRLVEDLRVTSNGISETLIKLEKSSADHERRIEKLEKKQLDRKSLP